MAQSKRELYERTREDVREQAARHDRLRGHLIDAADRHGRSRTDYLEHADHNLIRPADANILLGWCDGYDDEIAVTTPTDADHDTNRWGTTRATTTLRQWLVSVTAFARDLDGSLLDATTDDLNAVAQRMYEGTAVSVTKPLSKYSVRSRQNCIKRFLRHVNAHPDYEAAASPDGIAVFSKESTVVDPEDMHLHLEAVHRIFLPVAERNPVSDEVDLTVGLRDSRDCAFKVLKGASKTTYLVDDHRVNVSGFDRSQESTIVLTRRVRPGGLVAVGFDVGQLGTKFVLCVLVGAF